jgi:hypothetical protein
VDITTAVRTKGIAGNDINWIKVSPKELRVSAASGRNNPKIRAAGRMKKTNAFTERSLRKYIRKF